MLSCFPTECYIGHYGYNCNETCGHCMDLSQCSTVSGICHTGCSDGYMGSLCKKGAFILKRFVFKRNSETKSMGRWWLTLIMFTLLRFCTRLMEMFKPQTCCVKFYYIVRKSAFLKI